MKKAFDDNVPKFRPRLRGSAAPAATAEPLSGPSPAQPVAVLSVSSPVSKPARVDAPAPARIHAAPPTAPDVEATAPASSAPSRRERLDKVKRKVADAVRPVRIEAPPQDPSQAGESALSLVRDLEARVARARDLEEALRHDLSAARTDAARNAAETRSAAERLAAVEGQLEEKRTVLSEMLAEMNGLEEERDEAVERAQALATADEEQQTLLDEVQSRAEEAEKALAESRTETEKLSEELDVRLSEGTRLRSALAEVTRERDALAREVDTARRERDELAEAKRALEQVHQALAHARARLG